MKKQSRWRKALSLLLAASMLAQNCAVISASEMEAEIMIEQEGQLSEQQPESGSTVRPNVPEISIEAVEPGAEPKGLAEATNGKEALYTVTFESHSAEHGVICVDGTDLTAEAFSSYKKEVKAGSKYTFRVTASEGYVVDHVKVENQDVAKVPDKADEYEITVTKDTEIVITYKELSGQADALADNEAESASAPAFQSAVLTVGQQAYITGQEGTDHTWQILDESVVSIVSTDGALAELKANAEGTVYIAHDYQVDGESDIKMETFEVTVTEAETKAAAETEGETEAAPETSAAGETEAAAETETLTETEIQTEAESLAETESETETETSVETETEVLVDETEILAEADVPAKVRNAAAMAAPMALDDGIALAAGNEITIEVGKRLQLEGTSGSNHKWESSDRTIATVSEDDEIGIVKGVSEGTVIITHTWGSKKNKKSETFTVRVVAKARNYTLTFDANGGSNAPAAITIARDAENKEVILPGQGNMSRRGYTFMGWVEASNAGMANSSNKTIYPAGYTWTLDENKTLYALWATSEDARYFIRLDGQIPTEPGSYAASAYTDDHPDMYGTVKYNTFYADTVNGVDAHLGIVPTTSAIRAACNAKAGSIRFADGSSYTRCNSDEEFENKYYVLWYVIKQDPIHVDGVLLKKDLYNVIYDPNALAGQYTGTVPLGSQYAEGTTVTVANSNLARTGYEFLGWSEDKTATEPDYVAGSTFTMPGEDVTLYAVWRPKDNTVYRVAYYYQNEDGSYSDEATSTSAVRYGVTDRNVRVTDRDKTPDANHPDYVEDSENANKLYEARVEADGSTVLKVYFKRQVTIEGTKTWVDAEGTEHPQITVYLLKDGERISERSLNGETAYSFGKFDEFTADGKKYTYEVKEVAVDGYTTTYQGYNITNTKKTGSLTINKQVNKPEDLNITDTFYFTVTGDFGEVTQVTDRNGQTYTVENGSITVPVRADNSAILEVPTGTYTVEEANVENGEVTSGVHTYKVNTTGSQSADVTPGGNATTTFTNTIADEKTVTVTKTWDDQDNKYGLRPEADAFAVTLANGAQNYMAGGTETAWTVTGNTWSAGVSVPAYDENGQKLTYQVSETHVDGYQADAGNPATIIPADVSETALGNRLITGSLTVSKTVSGLEAEQLTDDSFLFTVTGTGMPDGSTVTLKHGESKTWENIPAGTYTVTESVDGTPKHVYTTSAAGNNVEAVNASAVSYQVTVGEAVPAVVAYTNTAVSTVFDWAEAELNASKILTGRALSAEEFRFVIRDTNGAVVAEGTNAAAADGEPGEIHFTNNGALVFDTIGTYTYTVSEVTPETPLGGVTYETNSFEVTVTVAADGEGGLTATLGSVPEDGIVFQNTYATNETSVTLTGTKTLNGRVLKTGEFTFDITEVTDAEGTETLADGYHAEVTNDAAGAFGASITYGQSDAGTHYYKITEVQPETAEPGMDYAENSYVVAVEVTDDGAGNLTAVRTDNAELAFVNNYTAAGTYQIEARKTLTGRDLNAGEFRFRLEAADGAPMPEAVEAVNAADGTVRFDAIAFTQADIGKTYSYKLSEVVPDEKLNGVTYDLEEKTVTVTVEDAGNGQLTITQDAAPEFVNAFTQGSQDIEGSKTWVDGENSNNTRPESGNDALQLTLYRTSAKEGSEEVVRGNDGNPVMPQWSGDTYTFRNVAQYDEEGYAYSYRVEEAPVSGYEEPAYAANNRFNITNTLTDPQDKTVSGTKTWVDGGRSHNNAAEVNLILYRNTVQDENWSVVPGAQAVWGTGSAANTYTFSGLDWYDENGYAYTYRVEEEAIAGYTSAQNGNHFTNTIAQDSNVVVSGRKTWVAPVGTQYPTIKVNLLRDGAVFRSVTLENGTTDYKFTGLDRYDLSDGHAYVYTVTEDAVDGYTVDYQGYNITNTIAQEFIEVSGMKRWVDPAGTVHPDITIRLLRDGQEVNSVTLKNGETSYSFENLPKYNLTSGQAYRYEVTEDSVEGYSSVREGSNFTNTINQDSTVSVSGTKTWIAPENTEHPAITINLLRDGTLLDSQTLENGTTSYTFTGLDRYDLSDGHEYVYTVTENAVEGYTSARNGNNFTNTIAQDNSVVVSGTKTWVDPTGTLHPTITIRLLRDGQEFRSTTLADGETGYAFENLPKYDLSDGHVYQYTVEEDAVEGYTKAQSGNNFTNTIAQDNSVVVSGTKTWIDPKGTEHPAVTINLLRDGVRVQSTTIEPGAESYAFTGLEKYDLTDGHEYVYTVEEVSVEGYTSSLKGTDFTNTIEQDNSVAVRGTKTWIDPEDTVHPDITINLLRDGTLLDSRTLENGTTEYAFENLPKYDLTDGHVYEYTVEEEAVAGYTSIQNGTDFRNTIAQDNSIVVSGTKTWIDPEGTVHPAITINLLRDDVVVDTRILTDGVVDYAFTDLDKYDLTDGHEYVYTVEEVPVEGYTSVQNGTDFRNTIAQDNTVAVRGTKTWVDPAGTEHPAITINLLRDGTEVAGTVTLENGETEYAFENLPKYDLTDGHIYQYTVEEEAVEGYSSIRTGNDFRNTINQDNTVSVSGIKTWIDPEGTVHPAITINLLRDNEVVDSQTLEDGTTSYAFTNLERYDLTDGHEYVYTVAEEDVAGYTSEQDGNNFTNTIAQDNSVVVSGTKTWVDPEGNLHPTITIRLLRDGEEFRSTTLADGETEYAFENLPKYDLGDGHVYQYTVEEDDVEGYTGTANGNNFTNTIAQDTNVVVSGTKTWVDPEGTIHPEITINLLRDGKVVDSRVLADKVTSYAFTGLERYDLTDGHEYVYTVAEEPVEGYTSAQDGNNFTNTIAQDNSVVVSGTKTWVDPEGTEHPEITINLLRDNVVVDSQTLADGTVTYEFTDLPKYDLKDGHIYEYTVAEEAVAGYTSKQNGTNFINTIAQDTSVVVSGTKTWVDPEGTVHPAITINLLRDNEVVQSRTLADGVTSYAFTGLEKYDLTDGHIYAYTVEEAKVDGYTSEQDGTNFINTIAQDNSVTVSGTKTWIDPAGTVHPEITINLLRDGEFADSRTLANGTTDYSFENLPKYDLSDGHVYEYTVEEEEIAGYTSEQDGTNFTNTIAQDYSVAVSGTKTWIDPTGTVHPEITINLLRDGEFADSRTLANGTTNYSFENLPKYDLNDGHVYEYTVEEEEVAGYTSVQNGTNFTNTIAQDNSVAVSGTKTWIDPEGTIHPEITINLLRDEEVIDSRTLTNGTVTYEFTNLPKYDLTDGHVYEYSVEEEDVTGYTSTQDGTNFTNTIVQDNSVAVRGTKTWIDPEETVHPAITINLLRDGRKVNSAVLADGTTEYEFVNLPKYDLSDGHVYEYTVEEEAVEGYTSEQNGTNFVNTIAQDNSVVVSGTKRWVDPLGTVHPAITINLLRDGEFADSRTLADGTTNYSFENLPKYDLSDGHVYEYTVEEEAVEGYTSEQDGTNFTNTIEQDNSIVVSGTKTWVDPAGTIHPEITIRLLRDGEEVDSQTLADGTVTYAFENLPKYDLIDGHVYEYTVTEDAVEGYSSIRNGYDFRNTINQDSTVSVSGIKTWIDPEGTEHPEITINLLRDNEEIDSQILADGTTSYSFIDLDRYDLTDGHEYEYTVEEEAVAGYTSEQDGTNFRNTIAQDNSVVVSGTKTWIDPEGTIHPEITIRLLRDGTEVDSRTLADGTVTYAFEDLPRYDLTDGHVYNYTVTEDAVEGYTSVQNGTDFTNTIAQDMSVVVSGTKTWIDPAGTEHPTITIRLLRDNIAYDSKELENGQTNYSFTGLPKYDLSDGHVYEYTVEEDDVEGYTGAQAGNNFTNTIAQDNSVVVSGTKTWIDPEGTAHPTITIGLLRDGERVASQSLADGTTDYRFENLPKYDLSDGHVYEYTVEEDPVDGYTSEQDGLNFINTIAQDYSVAVSGTKTWIDPAGTVHPEITINLLRDGGFADSRTLADGTTEYIFENLPKYDLNDGHVYEYTVEEEDVEGYTGVQSGTNFTNTIAQDYSVVVSGTKTWIDPAGTVHPEITINLLRDGEVADSRTLEDGVTEYLFAGLPKYDLTDGHVYEYTVAEAEVEGYTAVQTGNDITNTINQDNSVAVSGTKTWEMIDGEEYPAITINLLRDGEIAASQVLTDGATEYAFENLPKYAVGTIEGYTGAYDGHEFTYTVSENEVPGYTGTQDGTAFINTADTTSVEVTKSWQDGAGNALAEELIPEELTVELLRGGEVYGASAVLNAENGWSYVFEGLPTHDEAGSPYSYSVREESAEGFTGTATVQALLKTSEIRDGYTAALVNTKNAETPIDPEKTHTASRVQVEGTTQMVEVGETITYAITYYNYNNVAADVVITDTLPTGLEYVASSPEAEVLGQDLTWDFEGVAPFTGGQVEVTARVTQDALTQANPVLNNTASVRIGDAQQQTNTDDVTVYNPDWTVDKTVSGMTGTVNENGVQNARVGDELTYTITIANTGNATITKPVQDIFMVDGEEADPQLHLYQAEGSQGVYENGTITLAPGETAVLISLYTVGATDNRLINSVRAGSDPEDPESQIRTDVEPNPNWTVEKRLVNEGTGANGAFVLGETALFDIVVTNTGNTRLENLTVSEIEGAVFAEDEQGRYTVDAQANTATATLGEGESVTIRAEYTIGETDLNRTDLANVATATLGEEEKPSDPVPFTPQDRAPGLEVTKTVVSTPAAADGRYALGETITYQITLRNTGNLTLQNLIVQDAMTRPDNNGAIVPDGFEAVRTEFENAVLAPNETLTVTYSHIVTEQDLGGELVNAVTATGTPSVPNPDPERPDPIPYDEDEVSVVTEDPATSSIVVTKQLTDAFDNLIAINAATFYVSLFEDEALTRRIGNPVPMNFAAAQATSSVTFDGLTRGTYYVAETDAQGAVLGTNIEYDDGLFSPAYANGQRVEITENGGSAAFTFANQFLVLPRGFYGYVTSVAITKNVRSSAGRAQKSNETFYAGVFLDADHTRLATEDDGVSQSIIPLDMSGNASATAGVELANPEEGQRTYYITEVTADGIPVERVADFGYDWEVENEVITVDRDTTDASVTITNTKTEDETEEETDSVINTTDENGSNAGGAGVSKMNTKSVKTGDETPIFGFALLMTASALMLLILEEKRRRRAREKQ